MSDAPQPRIVVHTGGPPVRRWLMGGLMTVTVISIGYLLFEYGRSIAGFSVLEAREREGALKTQIGERDAAIQDLQRAAADLETFRTSQAIERSELARTIGDLQAQVARQSQQLEFYKGILNEKAAAAEVKIQQLRIVRGATDGRYVIKVTLVQPGRPETVVSGAMALTVEGVRDESPAKLDFASLSAGRQKDLSFSFRYLENLSPEIQLPAGFTPERLNLELRSSRRGIAPVSQTFLWSVENI